MTIKVASPLILAIAWTVLIIILLSLPGSSIPSISLFEADKLIHAGLFFILTLLWLRASADDKLKRALFIVGLILLFSFASEEYQGMLPFERTTDVFDSLADSFGALTGFAVWGLRAVRQKRQNKKEQLW